MHARRERIEQLIHSYERSIAPFTFIAGFIFDTLTLRRVDLWLDQLALLGFLALAGTAILVLNVYEAGRLRVRIADSVIPFVPVVMQFAFGGLFSAFIIFYTKSAAFGKSYLFLLALAVLLVGNERFRKRYQRLTFQLSIFFTALFSYSILVFPIVAGQMGVLVFLAGGLMSIFFLGLSVLALQKLIPRQILESRRAILLSIGGIYVFFHLVYFTNIIPPIPLSLKESGVYHSVMRTSEGGYHVRFEPAPWYSFFRETNAAYHWKEKEMEPVYFFSSVFAPTRLATEIFHRWYYYDEGQKEWARYAEVSFPIVGGRDGGYRGYSFVIGVRPGRWRVEVATGRGQVLGRDTFVVAGANETIRIRDAFK